MAANDWLCQFLADMLEAPVERPVQIETTALGAAFHAGLAAGIWSGLDALAATWERGALFEPRMDAARRQALIDGWRDALRRIIDRP